MYGKLQDSATKGIKHARIWFILYLIYTTFHPWYNKLGKIWASSAKKNSIHLNCLPTSATRVCINSTLSHFTLCTLTVAVLYDYFKSLLGLLQLLLIIHFGSESRWGTLMATNWLSAAETNRSEKCIFEYIKYVFWLQKGVV